MNRWPVSPERMESVESTAGELLYDPDPRIRLNAVKIFVEMSKVNQKDEHKALDIERDAQRQQLTVGTINNLLVSPEAVYELLERQHQDPPTIEHKG